MKIVFLVILVWELINKSVLQLCSSYTLRIFSEHGNSYAYDSLLVGVRHKPAVKISVLYILKFKQMLLNLLHIFTLRFLIFSLLVFHFLHFSILTHNCIQLLYLILSEFLHMLRYKPKQFDIDLLILLLRLKIFRH